MLSQVTEILHSPLKYIISSMESCCQGIVAARRIHIWSWMPWYYHVLIFQRIFQVQIEKNDNASLVLPSWVAPDIKREMICCQRNDITKLWKLLTFLTCIQLWCGSLQLCLPSWNHCQTLVEVLLFQALLCPNIFQAFSKSGHPKYK